jgi:hypothetical protein
MKIKDYTESKIRRKILSKVKPGRINKRSKHWKGYILIDNKVVSKVKIPNNHRRVIHHNKSKYIARDLKLDPEDFNRLIDCPMKRSDYYRKIAEFE